MAPYEEDSNDVAVSAEELIRNLRMASGRWEVWGRADVLDKWIAAGRRARRLGLLPENHRLEVRRRYITVLFTLLEGPHPNSKAARASLPTIPVPERLTKVHPVVRALRAAGLKQVSRSARPRAFRLLQALANESARRGHSMATGDKVGTVELKIGPDSFGVTIKELDDRIPHTPTPAELREKQRYSWTRIPEYEYLPFGKLSIELAQSWRGRQWRWSDGKRSVIEDRLAEVLRELELRSVEAQTRREEEARKRDERENQWKTAMETARTEYIEDARRKELVRQIDAWAWAEQVRTYLEAVKNRSNPGDGSGGQQWVGWVEAFAASIDPIRKGLEMPSIPEPEPEDLKPYLAGWSPHGPEGGWS